jgi:hypothetical protein
MATLKNCVLIPGYKEDGVIIEVATLSVTRISIKFIRCSNHSRFIQKRQSLH